MSLCYDELSAVAKRQIWTTFIDKARATRAVSFFEDTGITEERLNGLADRQLNGRQINNACRTATSLAFIREEDVQLSHVHEALKGMEELIKQEKKHRRGMDGMRLRSCLMPLVLLLTFPAVLFVALLYGQVELVVNHRALD